MFYVRWWVMKSCMALLKYWKPDVNLSTFILNPELLNEVEDFCHNSFALALIRPFCRTCGSEMGVGLGIAAVRPRAARHD